MTYKKKLIEVALPLEDINREAAREKSIRHGHPSTLHLWWARRLLAACRAVLFASLVDDPSECVAELMADATKRRAGEKALGVQRKARQTRKALFDKAQAAGISAPEPGPEPKLEEIIVEMERERLFDIIRELVKWENSNDERTLNKARAEILRSTGGNPPPVYDPFCGGGSIPLEAQRLGLEAHASDLNPVPVLINKALIEIPPRFAGKPPVNPDFSTANEREFTRMGREGTGAGGASDSRPLASIRGSQLLGHEWKGAAGLAADIRYYGQWMRDEAEKRIGHLYPKVAVVQEKDGSYRHATADEIANRKSQIQNLTVIAWLWARTVASPNPAAKGEHVPLMKSFWLSTKAGRKAWVEPVVDQSTMTYRFQIGTGNGEPRAGTVNRNGGVCVLTGSPIPLEYIRTEGKAGRLGVRLMAIVAEGRTTRIYVPPDEEHESVAKTAKSNDAPDTDLPDQALGFRVQAYGMTKHKQLFATRQLTMLGALCDLLSNTRAKATTDSNGDALYADAVCTYLGIAVSKLTAFHCGLGLWRATDNKTGRAFGRQAISMVWDFPEANPFADAGGELKGAFESLGGLVESLPARPRAEARQHDAMVAFEAPPALISTDPPYYDNIPYADLSDFFYIWLRRALHETYPNLFGTVLVPKKEELVAEPFRHGSREAAQRFFGNGLSKTFENIRQTSLPDFPVTVFYAFRQAEEDEDDNGEENAVASTGWETMLEGLVASNFSIDGTWPMRTEQSKALKGKRNALASSIVLVCRPRPKDAGVASRRDFLAALKRELPEALRNLQKGNIAPVDLAQAAIGPGMAVFSRYARVLEADGSPMGVRTALSLINQSLDEVLAEQEGEFDADTRWALAWFDQYGFTEGAYGQAEILSTAKNTSVSGMVEAGILAAKGGKVRLLKKEELPADWDPAADSRLTIWESTHYLIRALDEGEQAAAELLRKLGAVSEIARDLSYRLYTVCERRKWSQDAIGYNALVLAWPDLTRLAQEQKAAGPSQGELL